MNPPSGWNNIGDGIATVLTNGTYMQGSCCNNPPTAALLDASTLTWTSTGTGKFDIYSEVGHDAAARWNGNRRRYLREQVPIQRHEL